MTEIHRLLSLYHKELAHALRTPLAVVSNEIQFIELTSDVTNISKAKEKIGVIGNILKNVTENFPEPGCQTELDLHNYFQSLSYVRDIKGDSFRIKTSESVLNRVFQLQSKVLEKIEPKNADVLLSAEEKTAVLEFECSACKDMPTARYFYELSPLCSTLSKLEMISIDIFFATSNIEFQANAENGKLSLTYRFHS